MAIEFRDVLGVRPAQLDMLDALGCQLGQGYLLARPALAQTVEARLAGDGHVNAQATRIPSRGGAIAGLLSQ